MSKLPKSACELADMASTPEIRYVPTGNKMQGHHKNAIWHEMVATRTADGETWNYWLMKDHGSYRGSFFNGQSS